MPLKTDSSGRLVQSTNYPNQIDAISAKTRIGSPVHQIDKLMNREVAPSFLIWRNRGGLGDVLMTTPTVKAIKKKYNGVVDYATDFSYLDGALVKVLKYNPYIDKVIDHQVVDKTRYDAVVNLTCPCVAHEVPGASPINRIDLFARHAGFPTPLEDPGLDYFVTEEEKDWAKVWIEKRSLTGKRLIMVHANSSTDRRDYDWRRLQKAVVGLLSIIKNSSAIVVLHTKNQPTEAKWKLHNIIEMKDYDCRAIAAIMNTCELVICPDSSLLHLASALHKKTVTLFGPTDPRARVNYHPEAVAINGGHGLACFPSWYNPCRSGYICWNKISIEQIMEVGYHLMNDIPIPSKPEYVHFGNYKEGMTGTTKYEIL